MLGVGKVLERFLDQLLDYTPLFRWRQQRGIGLVDVIFLADIGGQPETFFQL